MNNNFELARKVEEYFTINNEISVLEINYEKMKNEKFSEYKKESELLKKEISDYFTKIKKTLDIICNMHSRHLKFDGYRLIAIDRAVKEENFSSVNAHQVARLAANRTVALITSLLYSTFKIENVDNLVSSYNTIVTIYENIDKISLLAVEESLVNYSDEIQSYERKREAIFTLNEYNAAIDTLYKTSLSIKEQALIQEKLPMEENYNDNIEISLGLNTISGNIFSRSNDSFVPIAIEKWRLNDDGLVIIKAHENKLQTDKLVNFVINTILQFLHSYPGSSKKVLLCDGLFVSEISTFVGELKSENVELFFNNKNNSFIKNSEDEIKDSINELNKIINERLLLLGQSRYSNILEYNSHNIDNTQPLILTLINGYPSKFNNAIDDLNNVLKNGKKAGVFFLVIDNKDGYQEEGYYGRSMPKLETYTNNIYELEDDYLIKDNNKIEFDMCGENYNLHSICENYVKTSKQKANPIIYLDSVCKEEEFNNSKRRKDYSMVLSVPIGKQGANPISIDLSAKDAPHLALIGTTGSGKTAFINSFVLSACKLYSPEELELHLIVMVKGDFRVFEEEKLPHLKTVVTGDRIFAANDVLDFIDDEMKRRGEIIGSLGNIYAYNEIAENPLPRCVIIIDEFYQLVQGSEEAVDRVNRIAQVGRAYGISLVISSIRFPMEVNSIIPLFEHKIEFKSKENAGQLIPEVAKRQGELEAANGLCFYSCKGNLKSVRVAYSEEGEVLKNHIVKIRNKYSDYQMELQSEIKAFEVNKETIIPYNSKRAKYDYDEEGIIRTRLGKVYLSNRNLEFSFESKTNSLFLFGHYLDTKEMEAALIKETLILSKHIDEPTVYYLDLNKNASLRRVKTLIKELRDKWVLDGKLVYGSNDDKEDIFDEIKDLIKLREEDEESSIHPVLVIISKAETALEDDDDLEVLLELINRGKDANIYFVLQCNECVNFYNSDKYINNAIIFPDRYSEGEDYTSDQLCKALENMPAGSTSKGKKIIANALQSSLHPMLHILCVNSQISIFVPYKYEKEYFN